MHVSDDIINLTFKIIAIQIKSNADIMTNEIYINIQTMIKVGVFQGYFEISR